MKLHPRVSRSLVELVKRFEGLRRRAARLPDGGWTVGYGHAKSAREGAVVSPEDAEALLYYDLSEVAEKVDAWTFTPLNQNQFEALTAFAFNIGPENFRRSTVLKRVNEGQHLQAAAALELWRKADFGGEDLVIDALVRRRAAEKAHFLTPPEGFRPSPTPVLRPTFDHSVIEAAALARAGRPAAVVDAPLDGDDAAAHVEGPAAPGSTDAAFPIAAAPAVALAVGAATAQLHRLFADEPKAREHSAEMKAEAPDPFTDTHPPSANVDTDMHVTPASVDEAPLGESRDLATHEAAHESAGIETRLPGYIGFGAADILSQPEPASVAPPSPPVFEAPVAGPPVPPFAIAPQAGEPEPGPGATLFDAPVPPAEGVRTLRLRDDAVAVDKPAADLDQGRFDIGRFGAGRPGRLHDRSMIYLSIGLLGVALFAAALFSMLGGKATPMNLIIGLMGILFMTPAGGYFLLKFLDKGQPASEL